MLNALVIRWGCNALALFVAAWVLDGVTYGDSWWTLLIAAAVFTLINAFVKPIVTILSIREGCVPPTVNLVEQDPAGAGLNLTPGTAARQQIRTALSNSFGFGGQNTALVFARWTG